MVTEDAASSGGVGSPVCLSGSDITSTQRTPGPLAISTGAQGRADAISSRRSLWTFRAQGTPPGSGVSFRRQVSWLARHRLLPPSRGTPQWHLVEARRLQLRGQLRTENQCFAPHSLFALPVAEKRPSAWKLRAAALQCQRGQIRFAPQQSSFIVAPSSVFDGNRERECGKDLTFEAAAAPATVCG